MHSYVLFSTLIPRNLNNKVREERRKGEKKYGEG